MNDILREVLVRVLIVCVAVTWLVILWRADRNPALQRFHVLGLIMTKDGFIDRVAVMELGSWIALTLTLMVLTVNDRLTEWFALIYAGLPAIRAGQTSWLRSIATPPIPSTTTTTDSSTSTSTKKVTREGEETP